MKYLFFTATMLVILFYNNCYAQVTLKDSTATPTDNLLKDLRKAGDDEIDHSKPLMLDGVIPVISEDGKSLNGEELMKVMMTGDYGIDPYIDKDKNIKAYVARKLTGEEKKRFTDLMQKNTEESDLTGKDAVPFSVTDINGKYYSLKELKGKIIAVNFWYIECEPCRKEIPELNKLTDKYSGKDVIFIAFAKNEKPDLNSFLENNEFKYNIIPGSDEVIQDYKISSFPANLVIDKNSKIIFYKIGFGPGSVDELDKAIEGVTE